MWVTRVIGTKIRRRPKTSATMPEHPGLRRLVRRDSSPRRGRAPWPPGRPAGRRSAARPAGPRRRARGRCSREQTLPLRSRVERVTRWARDDLRQRVGAARRAAEDRHDVPPGAARRPPRRAARGRGALPVPPAGRDVPRRRRGARQPREVRARPARDRRQLGGAVRPRPRLRRDDGDQPRDPRRRHRGGDRRGAGTAGRAGDARGRHRPRARPAGDGALAGGGQAG